MQQPHQPLPVGDTPDPVERELETLMHERFAAAWAAQVPRPPAAADALRARLLGRVARSRATSDAMFTARPARLAADTLSRGVQSRTLYTADGDRALRPGEPLRARLIALQAASQWEGPPPGHHCEWLVLRGAVRLGDAPLRLRDYHVAPAASGARGVRADEAALLFLRESLAPAGVDASPSTVRDDAAAWPELAPGIRRRVLWQHAGQAAMLYHAQPGAALPLHTHGHDEECLMLQGELFLDDVLLQPGDYQLAPAGTAHRITQTDTGVVIYAHGDLDLRFVA